MLGMFCSRTHGVRIMVDEGAIPEPFRTRLKDRRRTRPTWFLQLGVVIGLSLSQVMDAAAQGTTQAWLEPSTLIQIGTLIGGIGMAYQLLKEARQRIQKLEDNTVSKDAVATIDKRIDRMDERFDRMEEKIDRLLEK